LMYILQIESINNQHSKMTNNHNELNHKTTTLLLISLLLIHHMDAWITRCKNKNLNTMIIQKTNPHRSSYLKASSSSSNNNKEEKMDNRMEVIRSLQSAFYGSTAIEDDESPLLDLSTGTYTNLPLWRVSWTEIPGRSNVLHVHDPRYTNMFEKIIHSGSNPPYYFGHLYLERGSKALSKNSNIDDVSRLMNYKDYDMEHHGDGVIGSAVLGTLMRITDYRRIDDGRLLILVQAVERFVVTNVH